MKESQSLRNQGCITTNGAATKSLASCSLNPFEIRAVLLQINDCIQPAVASLNPFEIRAVLLPKLKLPWINQGMSQSLRNQGCITTHPPEFPFLFMRLQRGFPGFRATWKLVSATGSKSGDFRTGMGRIITRNRNRSRKAAFSGRPKKLSRLASLPAISAVPAATGRAGVVAGSGRA